MTSFTFSAEQVNSAPPEVRRWMENEIAKALGLQARYEHEPSKMHAAALAACTVDELAQIFSLISGNFLVSQVFFELGRETSVAHSLPSLHALSLGDMQRHVQLADGNLLIECLNVINQALQRAKNDETASLFASDEFGHVYIHETTYRNIRRLREQLVGAHSSAGLSRPSESGSFVPPRESEIEPEHAFPQNAGT